MDWVYLQAPTHRQCDARTITKSGWTGLSFSFSITLSNALSKAGRRKLSTSSRACSTVNPLFSRSFLDSRMTFSKSSFTRFDASSKDFGVTILFKMNDFLWYDFDVGRKRESWLRLLRLRRKRSFRDRASRRKINSYWRPPLFCPSPKLDGSWNSHA